MSTGNPMNGTQTMCSPMPDIDPGLLDSLPPPEPNKPAPPDDPGADALGTVRVFPRWQDHHHPRELAIRWTSPTNVDEEYPWVILDSEGVGLQRLSNDSLNGCQKISLSDVAIELGHRL